VVVHIRQLLRQQFYWSKLFCCIQFPPRKIQWIAMARRKCKKLSKHIELFLSICAYICIIRHCLSQMEKLWIECNNRWLNVKRFFNFSTTIVTSMNDGKVVFFPRQLLYFLQTKHIKNHLFFCQFPGLTFIAQWNIFSAIFYTTQRFISS
jgi:hypothetical protein